MTTEQEIEFPVGTKVWVQLRKQRRPGVVVEVVSNEQWGTPDYAVRFRWPDGPESTWPFERYDLEKMNAIDQLAEVGDG